MFAVPGPARRSKTPGMPGAPGDRWVLVIDDDSAFLSLVHDTLVAAGYDVVTASSGPVALDLLWSVGADQPDVILLDLDLPDLDGRQVAKLYRRIPVPHAPVLICSAAADAALQADRLGAAAVLEKPFDLDDLLAHVAELAPGAAAVHHYDGGDRDRGRGRAGRDRAA